MVSKIRGKTGIISCPVHRRMASVRDGPASRGSDPGDPGPVGEASRGRRPGKATSRVPHHARPHAKSQTAASPSLAISIPSWLREYSGRNPVSLRNVCSCFLAGRTPRPARVHGISMYLPIGPITSRAGRNFVFPPKDPSPARSIVSRPFSIFGSLPFVLLVLFYFFINFCRGDAVAMVNNNTPNFGTTEFRFPAQNWRKSDQGRECLKAPTEVQKRV
jgi:hypothetical protein